MACICRRALQTGVPAPCAPAAERADRERVDVGVCAANSADRFRLANQRERISDCVDCLPVAALVLPSRLRSGQLPEKLRVLLGEQIKRGIGELMRSAWASGPTA